MISEAKRTAEEHMPGLRVAACYDLGDKYAFAFCGLSDEVVPGTPFVCVGKGSDEVSFMTVPPLDNLDIIEMGKAVDEIKEALYEAGTDVEAEVDGQPILFYCDAGNVNVTIDQFYHFETWDEMAMQPIFWGSTYSQIRERIKLCF